MSAQCRRGLAPILAADARILILGSFPSEASLAAGQYYAHPRNHFWPLLGCILGEALAERPYAERLDRVRARGIGIWDSIVACERQGSLDASIRAATHGETRVVQRMAPEVALVCFNGKTAARAEFVWREAGYATLALPSTSPAYTLPFSQKLAAWQRLASHLPARPPIASSTPARRGPRLRQPA